MQKTRLLILSSLFVALTIVGAFIKIPAPLPFTLQTLFVFLGALILGPKWGAFCQLAYIALGLFGLPVFTSGGGIGYVLTPSFGFLLGFAAGAYVCAALAARLKSWTVRNLFLCVLAGMAVMYVIGLPYMYASFALYLGTPKDIGWILQYGLLIFIPGDLLKAFLASVVAKRLRPYVGVGK